MLRTYVHNTYHNMTWWWWRGPGRGWEGSSLKGDPNCREMNDLQEEEASSSSSLTRMPCNKRGREIIGSMKLKKPRSSAKRCEKFLPPVCINSPEPQGGCRLASSLSPLLRVSLFIPGPEAGEKRALFLQDILLTPLPFTPPPSSSSRRFSASLTRSLVCGQITLLPPLTPFV